MANKKYFLLLLFSMFYGALSAQNFKITGAFADEKENTPLVGVSIILYFDADSSNRKGGTTDLDGRFEIGNLAEGTYKMKASYIGFTTLEKTIKLSSPVTDLGKIKLKQDAVVLKEVKVEGLQTRVQQKGDTTQFNAGAYKTNPDASAEDLVTKMPGVTSENGQMKVNGENVQEVLVDGKPFFGDDPNAALKNLPADVIDKIQVYDKASEQSQFTGFNDGNTTKSINIITKPGRNKGQFGKIYAGYGPENRYIAGGNINFFDGNRRISLLGLSNNVNQQNFSSEDLLGISGSSSGGGGRGRGRMRGGSDASNFMIGQQNGIAVTNAFGINYSDVWGKKIKTTGSYFFNRSNADNYTLLRREYITAQDSGLLYNEESTDSSRNINHRINFRFEYEIDSSNTIIFTPRFSLQDNFSSALLTGSNSTAKGGETGINSFTRSSNSASNTGYNFNSNLLFQHKFDKKGRTVSLNIGTDINNRNGNADQKSYNLFNYLQDTLNLDQHIESLSDGQTLSGVLMYTEPIDSTSQLLFTYAPTYTLNNSNRETRELDFTSRQYSILDTALSNKYDNTYFTNRAGVSFRKSKEKYALMAGINYQYATLQGNQFFPYSFDIDKNFSSILPVAMFRYKFSSSKNIRFFYRSSTDAPSISQLQDVINNNNPLLLRTGNPNLRQDNSHTFVTRYSATNTTKATSFFGYIYGTYTQDYIGNSTILPSRDSILPNGILLARGSQFSRPVNLDGYYTGRAFLTFGMPLTFLKSNLNLHTGFNYNHTPALVNGITNFANNYNFSQGVVLGSNISENVDFNIGYNANYSIVKNTLQKQSDNNYFYHNASLRLNWIFLENFVFNTSLNQSFYAGLSRDIDQDYLLWNASIGYKLLKNKSLEAKFSVYDILNQNSNITRSVTETYIEDSQTNVLNRYFLFTLSYNLKKFAAGAKMPENNMNNNFHNMPGR